MKTYTGICFSPPPLLSLSKLLSILSLEFDEIVHDEGAGPIEAPENALLEFVVRVGGDGR